jgi:hypothetical protein
MLIRCERKILLNNWLILADKLNRTGRLKKKRKEKSTSLHIKDKAHCSLIIVTADFREKNI